MTPESGPAPARRTAGVLASAALLALMIAWLGPRDVLARLAGLDQRWLVAGLVLSSLQFVLLGVRWAQWARALGVPLSLRDALREYYLSALLNQVLPFGVLGDGVRALRHVQNARTSPGASDRRLKTRVVLALLCDRGSGQLALWALALSTLPFWLSWRALAFEPLLLAGVAAIGFATLALYLAFVRARRAAPLRAELGALLRRVLSPREIVVNASLSLASIMTLVAAFSCCAAAVGTPLSPLRGLCVVPWILIAASIPGFFAGWGIRELTAVGVYALSGLDVTTAASVSVVFGIVSLISSVPGVLPLCSAHRLRVDPARP